MLRDRGCSEFGGLAGKHVITLELLSGDKKQLLLVESLVGEDALARPVECLL